MPTQHRLSGRQPRRRHRTATQMDSSTAHICWVHSKFTVSHKSGTEPSVFVYLFMYDMFFRMRDEGDFVAINFNSFPVRSNQLQIAAAPAAFCAPKADVCVVVRQKTTHTRSQIQRELGRKVHVAINSNARPYNTDTAAAASVEYLFASARSLELARLCVCAAVSLGVFRGVIRSHRKTTGTAHCDTARDITRDLYVNRVVNRGPHKAHTGPYRRWCV